VGRLTSTRSLGQALPSPSGFIITTGAACGRRGIIGPSNTPSVIEYPAGSMSQSLLDRCLEAAVSRGTDLTAAYKPWIPVDLMQTMILDVHEALGCSWSMAIVAACLGIRIVTLPVSIAAIRGAREKALIQPIFMELTEKQKQLSLEGDQEKVAAVSKEIQEFTQKHGKLFMLKGTWNLFLFQVPLYITAFAAMRGFASHPDIFPGFSMEAPLWLDSLALADPYTILPCFTCAIMLTNTELFGSIDTEVAAAAPIAPTNEQSTPVGGVGTFQKYQKWIMRGSALMFVPLTMSFPSGVFIFMCTNMIASTAQNRILRQPALERLLEIPPAPEANAAAKIAYAGPPTLLPLFSDLQRIPTSTLVPSRSSLATEVDKGDDSSSPNLIGHGQAAHTYAGDSFRKILDIDVNPKFAVRRA